MDEHQIWCYFWCFWLKGLQIATVGLADGFRDGHANGAEKRSEALVSSLAVKHLKRRRRGEEREQCK
jgi:hypothetical protein